jgi:hypothetical protein
MSSIIVIDMSPELFWYASGALASLNIPLKHFPDSHKAESIIFSELPDIVILNGDDGSYDIAKFVSKMRNHVFARNVMLVVFTANPSHEFRKSLIVMGAAFVFFKAPNHAPNPVKFSNSIKWLLDYKVKETNYFDSPMLKLDYTADVTSWGRLGYISENHLLIESNFDLNPGDSINLESTLLEELGIKDPKFICQEKNKVGRYYQYANTFLGRIETKKTVQDFKTIKSWIKTSGGISKNKSVKIVYFESDGKYREEITKMIKTDSKYCARGYAEITGFEQILNYQMPQLILINRNLIQKDKKEFDAIKKYLEHNFCFCITYALDEFIDIAEFKKNYESFMHVTKPLDIAILESMIKKLEDKMPVNPNPEPKVIFNKHSVYSRVAFNIQVKVTDVSNEAIQVRSPLLLNTFCSAEMLSKLFIDLNLTHQQMLRVVEVKKNTKTADGFFHKLVFIGLSSKEKESIELAIEEMKKPPLPGTPKVP